MSFLTEQPSSHPPPPLMFRAEDMTQLVTTPNPVELASTLEELSGLASQIVRYSHELQTVSQCDSFGNGTNVCHALLPVALSSAQNCLSILQFVVSQISTSPPYVLYYQHYHFLADFFS